MLQWHANEMDMADDLDEARAEGRAEGIEQGIELGIEQGIKTGIEQGIELGIEQGIKTGIKQGKTESVIVLKEIMYRLRKGETAEELRKVYAPELVEAVLEMIRH